MAETNNMTEGNVIKIKRNNAHDDYSFEELASGTPESIKHENYEKEYKRLLSQEYEEKP